jgi:hypothetical protein
MRVLDGRLASGAVQRRMKSDVAPGGGARRENAGHDKSVMKKIQNKFSGY